MRIRTAGFGLTTETPRLAQNAYFSTRRGLHNERVLLGTESGKLLSATTERYHRVFPPLAAVVQTQSQAAQAPCRRRESKSALGPSPNEVSRILQAMGLSLKTHVR